MLERCALYPEFLWKFCVRLTLIRRERLWGNLRHMWFALAAMHGVFVVRELLVRCSHWNTNIARASEMKFEIQIWFLLSNGRHTHIRNGRNNFRSSTATNQEFNFAVFIEKNTWTFAGQRLLERTNAIGRWWWYSLETSSSGNGKIVHWIVQNDSSLFRPETTSIAVQGYGVFNTKDRLKKFSHTRLNSLIIDGSGYHNRISIWCQDIQIGRPMILRLHRRKEDVHCHETLMNECKVLTSPDS